MHTEVPTSVTIETADGIATVTLANPQKRNALSRAAMNEMLPEWKR